MGTWAQDLRYAVRAVRTSPAFTAGAALTLALGIGASAATFSVVDAVVLKPLPYREPERLVAVWPEQNFNAALLRDLLAASPALESGAGAGGWSFTLTGLGEPLEVQGARVSVQYFRVLGVRPLLGRDFAPEEGVPGSDGVAVISHSLWTTAFGADPGVVGRTIQLGSNDLPARTVIGVLPPDFRPLSGRPEVWVPIAVPESVGLAEDGSWYVNERVARLAPGATLEQASAQVRAFARVARGEIPRTLSEASVRAAGVESLRVRAAGPARPVLWAALGAVALVLLIACANVANLLLARGEARARDLAVRMALGSARDRLVRLLMTESALLGLMGGVGGVLLAWVLLGAVMGLAPADFPRLDEVRLDARVLAFALVATGSATLLAGVIPALRVSRVDPASVMGGASRGAAARRSTHLTRALVGLETALALVVLVGSGLMLRSLHRMTTEDTGLDADGVWVFQATPPSGRYPDGPAFHDYYARVLERIRALPQVEAASAIQLLPGRLADWSFPTFPEGVDPGPGETVPSVGFRIVWPGYFDAVGMDVRHGRTFQDSDNRDGERVAVVNQAFVDRFWAGESAVGRTVRHFSPDGDAYRVVGVVSDVRQHGLGRQMSPGVYVVHDQVPWNTSFWIVARLRGGVDAPDPADALRDAVWSVDADVPFSGLDRLSRVFDASAATTRFLTAVLGGFGALAVLLGAVGVFGVTSYTVERRVPEFGVRVALGATRAGVVGHALRGSLSPVAAGLVAGLGAAWASGRVLASALYGVSPSDPATFAAAAALLAGLAAGASLLPAWRAGRVDPAAVLKGD